MFGLALRRRDIHRPRFVRVVCGSLDLTLAAIPKVIRAMAAARLHHREPRSSVALSRPTLP
jgi:hypothetical protein